jgi:hypothetical protein
MIKKITIVLFLLTSITLSAQNPQALIGKWVFKEALNKGIDKLGRQTLKKDVINKWTYEFKSTGEFIWSAQQTVIGKWTLAKDSKSIILEIEGQKMEVLILEFTATRLVLKMGKGEFLMKKI